MFLGGVCGTALRFWFEQMWPASGASWPWGTFAANLSGAFILGTALEALTLLGPDGGWRQRIRLFLGTGFCGAFTTYSALALEIDTLTRNGFLLTGVAYALVSVTAGLVAALGGIAAAGRVLAPYSGGPE
ncbi:camphor resistance protein CrcB [Mycobacteroides saopaulense]|uniref:Fluoride-specific ion channel FluC n=1 Tax=Mycobacteroides saopaulense TaxID=1578165 RepID=A0ABX3C138_9MYCO|nr:camphor resistance protein CrcB [Mycobacteroides saopaulense]OHU10175.1 camphor resistance protein CrcB [Mycobacteroides saopaulense]